MIDPAHIVQSETKHTAVIRLTVPRGEIRRVMGPAISEVISALAAQGIAPAGPVFSHHFKMDPAIFDFEVGVPVASPITAKGRVEPGELAARTVARTVYRGGYEGLGQGWEEFMTWIAESGHTPAPDLWECYVTGPESSPDPAMWRTELNRPLVSQASAAFGPLA